MSDADKILSDWIERTLELKKPEKSKKGLAKALGRAESAITAILVGGKNGKLRRIQAHEVPVIAQYLEESVPEEWLMLITFSSDSRMIPIVGKIGLHGVIEAHNGQFQETLFEIKSDVIIDGEPIGFQVVSPSMYPHFFEGDIVVVDRRGEPVEGLHQSEAIVLTEEGCHYLKRLFPTGSIGVYDLAGHNVETMRAVRLSWASGVICIIPSDRVKKLMAVAPREDGRV